MDAGRKETAKEAREIGRQEKVHQKERDGQKGNGQTLVTLGTTLGTVPIGTAKRMVSRWIHGQLLSQFLISVQSVLKSSDEEFSEPKHVFRERERERETKILPSAKEFTHANRFSSLEESENELSFENCTSVHTANAQCQQWVDERGDGCIANKSSLKQSAHQVSYLAVSGGTAREFIMWAALDGEESVRLWNQDLPSVWHLKTSQETLH